MIYILVVVIMIVFFVFYYSHKWRIHSALGLRNPSKYDGYEKKGEMQFRDECARFSISTDAHNTPNLCSIIPVLNMKGLHLEFVKDGNEIYRLRKNKYIGSDEWQEKWRKIIFSPTITSVEFCKCVKTIMRAHKFSESDNMCFPYVKGLDGRIEVKDSFFIFRALYIMHYSIRIRKNDDCDKKFMVSRNMELKQRNNQHFNFSYPEFSLHFKVLSNIVDIKKGEYIDESKITIDSKHSGLIFSSDIENGHSSLFYKDFYVHDEVYQGYIIINQNKPFEINRWAKDGCILTPGIFSLNVIYEEILADYLIYYLKLLLSKLKEIDDFESIVPDVFLDLVIPIPPRSIQRFIISQKAFDNPQLLDSQIKDIIESSIKNNISILKDASIGINEDTLIVSPRKWVKGYYKKNGTYVRGYFKN